MDIFLAYKRIRAAEQRTAQQIAMYRHVHLSQQPMVLCAYHLAGEVGAPIAFLYGTSESDSTLRVIGEPRNRGDRFRALHDLALDFDSYFGFYFARRQTGGTRGKKAPLAIDAPQIIVPNAGTADWLSTLARSTVWLQTTGDNAVDPVLPKFGAHLTQLSNRRSTGGSANILSATEMLNMHWATGQTRSEDENLPALLSWIDPQWLREQHFTRCDLDLTETIRIAETLPSAGPVPDPGWDREELAPAIAAYNSAVKRGVARQSATSQLEDVVHDALAPTWSATWKALELTQRLDEAPSVERRWALDLMAWTRHIERVDEDRAWFRRFQTATQSARMIARSEAASDGLAADMALDDPLVMARSITSGAAIEGVVIARNDDYREMGPSGRSRVKRPLLTIQPHEECLQPAGATLYWSVNPKVAITLREFNDDGSIKFAITAGMRQSQLPEIGETGCFATFSRPRYYPDTLPTDVPWTHVLPTPAIEEFNAATV